MSLKINSVLLHGIPYPSIEDKEDSIGISKQARNNPEFWADVRFPISSFPGLKEYILNEVEKYISSDKDFQDFYIETGEIDQNSTCSKPKLPI